MQGLGGAFSIRLSRRAKFVSAPCPIRFGAHLGLNGHTNERPPLAASNLKHD